LAKTVFAFAYFLTRE